MIRITNKALVNSTLQNIYRNYDKLQTLEGQISTGKRILKPSDDPVGAVFSIKSNARANEIKQYQENLDHANLWLENSESAINSVGDLLVRVKELALRGANGTLTQDDRDKVASELNGLISHLIDLANTDMAGDHLFAGSKLGEKPFAAVSGRPANVGSRQILDQVLAVLYQGDTAAIERNDSPSTRLQVNENGESAFFDVTRQRVSSTKVFPSATGALDPNLRTGYITVSGRLGDEVIRIRAGDSLREIASRITAESRQVAARVVPANGGFRLEIEALRDGKNNQVSISAGGPPGVSRIRTNLLDILGVSDGVASAVREGSATDKIRSFNPDVVAGYFFVNGNLIQVDPSRDTLSDVAARINALKQDVRADVQDGALTLRSTGSLTVKDGSSNFPSLMGYPTNRLASSNYIMDNAARQIPLAANEWVRNGNFTVNGQSIGVQSAETETIYTIIDRINAAGAGVTARMATLAADGYDDRMIIEAMPGGRVTGLVDGTSQFVKSFQFAFKSDAAQTPASGDNLQGLGVTGSFRIYDKVFTLNAADSLDTVMNRINAAALGVRASVDPDGRFTIEPSGVTDGFDTTSFADEAGGNFFASMRFASRVESAVSVTAPHVSRPIGYDRNAGIVSGTVVIGGKEFTIDAATMKLSDVAAMINASDLEVAARVTDANGITLDSRGPLEAFDATVWRTDPIGAASSTATPLSGLSALSPLVPAPPVITSGFFKVNGNIAYVDANGSLEDFVAAVNKADPKVLAEYDPINNNVKIRNRVAGADVILEPIEGDTNVLTALGLDKPANRTETNFLRRMGVGAVDLTDSLGNTVLRGASTQARSLFDIVIELRDKLLVGDLDGIANDEADPLGGGVLTPSSLRLIDDAIAHNSEIQTRFGTRMNRVEHTASRYRDVEAYLQKIIAKNEDVDIEKVVVEFNALQNLYNASLMVGARVVQPTLMDYLR